jgi:hypothetical protein
VTVNPDPNDLKSIPPEDRKRLEGMGEAYVRRVMSMPGGLPYPLGLSATRWLTGIDEEAREVDRKAKERNEAHQLEQARLNKSTQRAAWIAAGLAGVSILVSVGLWYAQDQTAKAEVTRHKMIKEGIGQYIGIGRAIMDRFGRNEMPLPITDEAEWVGTTENFLRTNLGDRFSDISGLGSVTGNGTDPAHNAYFNNIYGKITRLEEFSHEIP